MSLGAHVEHDDDVRDHDGDGAVAQLAQGARPAKRIIGLTVPVRLYSLTVPTESFLIFRKTGG